MCSDGEIKGHDDDWIEDDAMQKLFECGAGALL
jgi:hypothetical protein